MVTLTFIVFLHNDILNFTTVTLAIVGMTFTFSAVSLTLDLVSMTLVLPLVVLVHFLLGKRLGAHRTRQYPVTVVTFEVDLQCTVLGCGILTVDTLKWLLPCMYTDVNFEVTPLYRGIVALLTLVGLDSCVFTHVLLEVYSLVEGIITLVTLEWS